MNEEKLIADAWEAGSEDYFADDPRRDAFEEGFMRGARWHESLSLAERLTEEEKAKIRNYHRVLSKDKHIAIYQRSYSGLASTDALLFSLEQIFGKDLFTKSE